MPTTHPVQPFFILSKPTGAQCNLACDYCFFLKKENLYPGSRFRMPDAVLESFIEQYVEAQDAPEVTIAWQGGEPTLMGLDFFRRSIEISKRHCRSTATIRYSMQTNGVLLDDEWCEFFRENDFLIGISLDGPRPMHDAHRKDKGGKPTFDRVMRGVRLLQRHRVEYNILTTVHAGNACHPIEVYKFIRDDVGCRFLQLIPIVERASERGFQEGTLVTERSVRAEQWGQFLIRIFDEWVRKDVGRVFVQMFDSALASWAGRQSNLCLFRETCGDALALEHNGDLYSCDHFVEPKYLLGNITETPMADLVASDEQRMFGLAKRATLPTCCLECDVLFACRGECPKNRFRTTPAGEPGLNYLCEGYKSFFRHIDKPMQMMAELLRCRRSPAEVMPLLSAAMKPAPRFAQTGRNEPCPCGSGRKFKRCHRSNAQS